MVPSLAINAIRMRAARLASRLDGCAKRVEGPAVRSHVLLYAAFLSDMKAGRLDAQDINNQLNLNLVRDFCDLVDRELPAGPGTRIQSP